TLRWGDTREPQFPQTTVAGRGDQGVMVLDRQRLETYAIAFQSNRVEDDHRGTRSCVDLAVSKIFSQSSIRRQPQLKPVSRSNFIRSTRCRSAFNSSSLRSARERQRLDGGVSAEKPDKKVRVSATVKPASSASRIR